MIICHINIMKLVYLYYLHCKISGKRLFYQNQQDIFNILKKIQD